MQKIQIKYQGSKYPTYATIEIDPEEIQYVYDLHQLVCKKYYPGCPTYVNRIEAQVNDGRGSRLLEAHNKLLPQEIVEYYDFTRFSGRCVSCGETYPLTIKYDDQEYKFEFRPDSAVGVVLQYISDKIFNTTGKRLRPWDLELYEPSTDVVLHPHSPLGAHKNVAPSFVQFKTIDVYKPGGICNIVSNGIYYQTVVLGSFYNASVIAREKTVDFTEIVWNTNCNGCGKERDSFTWCISPDDKKYYCEFCIK